MNRSKDEETKEGNDKARNLYDQFNKRRKPLTKQSLSTLLSHKNHFKT